MKKLRWLTFVFTLFACSGGDDNNNSEDYWSGTYTIAGDQETWNLVADYEGGGSGYVEYSGSLLPIFMDQWNLMAI